MTTPGEVTPATPAPATSPAAGWYDDGSGRMRWYDGTNWTDQYQAPAVPVQTDSRKARDKAVYTREQKGHSLILHILLAFVIVGLFTIPYYSISPNHYWHA